MTRPLHSVRKGFLGATVLQQQNDFTGKFEDVDHSSLIEPNAAAPVFVILTPSEHAALLARLERAELAAQARSEAARRGWQTRSRRPALVLTSQEDQDG